MLLPMPPSLYVTVPSWALENPLQRRRKEVAAESFAERFGLEVVLSPLLARYLPGDHHLPTADRMTDLRLAMAHPLVWACRGGHGAMHLVEELLALDAPEARCLIGYSDATVLHACWWRRGWGETLFGQLPRRFSTSRAADSMLALAQGEGLARDQNSDPGVRMLRPGRAHGRLFAGNLSMLAALCGTPAQPDLRGCILAIEDVDEPPFTLDNALTQLRLAGVLDGVTGLAGGTFTYHQPLGFWGPSVDDVLASWCHRLGVPGLARLPFGHLDDGLVLALGRPSRLETAADGTWSFTQEASGRPVWSGARP